MWAVGCSRIAEVSVEIAQLKPPGVAILLAVRALRCVVDLDIAVGWDSRACLSIRLDCANRKTCKTPWPPEATRPVHRCKVAYLGHLFSQQRRGRWRASLNNCSEMTCRLCLSQQADCSRFCTSQSHRFQRGSTEVQTCAFPSC